MLILHKNGQHYAHLCSLMLIKRRYYSLVCPLCSLTSTNGGILLILCSPYYQGCYNSYITMLYHVMLIMLNTFAQLLISNTLIQS